MAKTPSAPDIVQTIVVPRSSSGNSIHQVDRVDQTNIRDFLPRKGARLQAKRRLQSLGFEVHDTQGPALVVRGPRELYERIFKTRLPTREHVLPTGIGRVKHVLCETRQKRGFIAVTEEHDKDLSALVSVIAVSRPVHLFATSAAAVAGASPPNVSYHHFTVPRGVADALNATKVHGTGIDGSGMHVAVCDTGVGYHPLFTAMGYTINAVTTPACTNPRDDASGHGTAVVANLLAIAPGATLTSVKMNFDTGASDTSECISALQVAAQKGARIVNCSWGLSLDTDVLDAGALSLAYVIAGLVHDGLIIVAASGDFPRTDPTSSGIFGFPAQHPSVIAAGGAYLGEEGALSAASYASGFSSLAYTGRVTPDVCGLCGNLPVGVLIMSPVPAGSIIDTMAAQNPFPNGDNTAPNDGWACFSGTSLSSPQIAGCIALAMQANPALSHPHLVRAALMLSARDVATGSANPNAVFPNQSNQAQIGFDLATGAGFVDAERLLEAARLVRPAATPAGPAGRKRSSPASRKRTAKRRK
jgi:hypothetical protein